MQLTPEQEQKIQAVVNAGAYSSIEEGLDAAVAAVESAAIPGFEGRFWPATETVENASVIEKERTSTDAHGPKPAVGCDIVCSSPIASRIPRQTPQRLIAGCEY